MIFNKLFKFRRRHGGGSSAAFHSKLIAKARHRDKKKPFVEQTVDDDLHRKSDGHRAGDTSRDA